MTVNKKFALPALLCCIFAAGLWLRLAVPEKSLRFDTDEGQYYRLGRNIAGSGLMFEGFPENISAFRMPLYPAFIAVSLKTFRGGPRGVRAAQALLNAFAVFLLFYAGLRLHSALCGVLAAALWALSPQQIDRASLLYIESFYSFLTAAVLCGLAAFLSRVSWKRAALFGALCGTGLAARSTLFLFPLVVPLVLLVKKDYAGIKPAFAAFLLSLALLVPWTARNYACFGGFFPFEKDAAIVNLYTAAAGSDTAQPNNEVYGRLLAKNPGLSFPDADALMRKEIRASVLGDPASFAAGCARRALKFAGMVRELLGGWWVLYAVLCSLAVLLNPGNAGMLSLAGFCAYFVLIHSPMSVATRYLYPLMPALVLLASQGAASAVQKALKGGVLPWAGVSPEAWEWPLKASAVFLLSLYGLTLALAAKELPGAKESGEISAKYAAGMAEFTKGGLKEASVLFDQLIGRGCSAGALAKIYNDRGVIRLFERNYSAASADFKRSLELRPGGLETYANLFYAENKAGNKPGDRRVLQGALSEIRGGLESGYFETCGALEISSRLLSEIQPDAEVLRLRAKAAELFSGSCGPRPAY